MVSKKFTKLEKHVEREYDKPGAKFHKGSEAAKIAKTKGRKAAAEYVGKAVAGQVARRRRGITV